jgi:hypothetical protein
MADKKEKTPLTPEQKARRRAAKVVAWTIWSNAYRIANPNATKEERRAAWAEAKGGEHKLLARRIVKALENKGYGFSEKAPAIAAE